MEKLSQEQREDIEKQVDEAEEAGRKSSLASREIFKETGIPKKERQEIKIDRDKVLEESNATRFIKKAFEREELFEREAEEILGDEKSPERALTWMRKKNLIKALRDKKKLDKEKNNLFAEQAEILDRTEGNPGGSSLEALKEIREELREISQKEKELLESSPEAYFGLNLGELKKYKKNLKAGRIAEVPYVKEKVEDIVAHLRNNKPVMIYGHLGSGKTELAMHIAKEYTGKKALIISGAKDKTLADLYGHQILDLDKIKENELQDFQNKIENAFNQWKINNSEANEKDIDRAHERILQIWLIQHKNGTISRFLLGPVYMAWQENRTIIIDEADAFLPEVLISLNHILTRVAGEKVEVQGDGGEEIEVGKGGIIMTGNLQQGEKEYTGTQKMNIAFLSRLYKIEYDYLPQYHPVEANDSWLLEENRGHQNELFQVLISKVMDKNGNIEAPADSVEKIWKLSCLAKEIQEIFSGRLGQYYFQQAGRKKIDPRVILKESVLSIRALNEIISQWQGERYKYELDYYIYQEFISQSTRAEERAMFYQMFQIYGGFFQTKIKSMDKSGNRIEKDTWEQNPSYGTDGVIASFDIKPPKNLSAPIKFSGPRETVECAFGKAPKRAEWPKIKAVEEIEESKILYQDIIGLENFKTEFDKNLQDIEKEIDGVCKMEEKEQ